LSLPTYPFARERHWVSDSRVEETIAPPSVALHPLLSYNSSTLREYSFTALLSDAAFYATDHRVNGEPVFPGAGLLEMACVSGAVAAERRVRRIADIVWAHPLRFRGGPQTVRIALTPVAEQVEYGIASLDEAGEPIVHSEGRLVFGPEVSGGPAVSIAELKARAVRSLDGPSFYDLLGRYGLRYGPAFQAIRSIDVHDGSFALSRLELPQALRRDFERFVLHPSLLDAALQTAGALAGGLEPQAPLLPFALDAVEIFRVLPRSGYALAEAADGGRSVAGMRRFDIQILNDRGEVVVRLRNLLAREASWTSAAAISKAASEARP
jgi:acyl transferase domain-containing protein